MDNQHQKITGYRDFSQDEIDLMNKMKALEAEIGNVLAALTKDDAGANRWAAIARTHLETGFMFAMKAVARPTTGLGRF